MCMCVCVCVVDLTSLQLTVLPHYDISDNHAVILLGENPVNICCEVGGVFRHM